MSARGGRLHGLVEFFTLENAITVARALPEESRSEAERKATRAVEKREAAEDLWTEGKQAEALKIVREALALQASALETLDAAAVADGSPEWVHRSLARVRAASQALTTRPAVELDAELRPEDASVFREVHDALCDVEAWAGPRFMDATEIASARTRRRFDTVAAAVLIALFLVWWMRPPSVTARASSYRNDDAPSRVLDKKAGTNWAPMDGETGWLELKLDPPRAVNELRVIPYNYGFENRFTKDVHVTAYRRDKAVASMDFSFPGRPRIDPTVGIPLNAPKCDRIRIDITSFAGLSSSIAEIEIK